MKETSPSGVGTSPGLWIVLGIWLAVILALAPGRFFDRDELEAVHTAWKLAQGERIYLDFFQHHHPLFYYLLTPALSVAGPSTTVFAVFRVLMFLCLLVILGCTYRLAVRIYDRETAIISLVLLATTHVFLIKVVEIRPDVVQTLLGMLALVFLFRFLDSGSRADSLLSAFFLGLSFLALQKSLFLLLLVGAVLAKAVYRKQIRGRELVGYGLACGAPLAIYGGYLYCTGAFSAYWTFNWLLNMHAAGRFSPLRNLGNSLAINFGLWSCFVWGAIRLTRTAHQERLRLLSFGLLASLFLVPLPYRQYFMLAVPLMAMIAAAAFCSIFTGRKAGYALLALILVPPGFIILKEMTIGNSSQLGKINYVLALTDAKDRVYDGENSFNVFRRDLDFFWFSLSPQGALATYRTLRDERYDIYELIARFEPKVISNNYIENPGDPRIKDHYRPSDRFPGLFIRTTPRPE